MSRRAFAVGSVAVLALVVTSDASAGPFTYNPPGALVAGSGKGRVDTKVYAPGIRFPMEKGPAFANSQVWGAGGSSGPGGSQCSASNYDYPWKDNYCETRSWDMPLCPSGTGHQGQDIRPATCEKDLHWVVAAADGTITNIGSYSVYLTGADGTRYDYLHMSNVQVKTSQKVTKGQRIGKVSNVFGGTPTTIHLHFNLRQNVAGVGSVYVPTYMSLIKSYEALLGPPPVTNVDPKGQLDAASCDEIRGWAQDPDVAAAPIGVQIWVDSVMNDPKGQVIKLTAGKKRDDLCGPLGSCEHGFSTVVPRSLLDGKPHVIHAYAMDSGGGKNPEIAGSPKTLTCALVLPDGVKRHVTNATSYASWSFDAFWQQVTIDDGKLAAIVKGDDLPAKPILVKADDDSPEIWLIDGDRKRHIPSPDVMAAWEFDGGAIETWTRAKLDATPKGTSVRSFPYLVKGGGPEVYLIDDPQPPPGTVIDDDAGTPGNDAGRGPGDETGAGNAADEATYKGGCACDVPRTGASSSSWVLLSLAGLVVALRRRRHL